MDDSRDSLEDEGHVLQGPHWHQAQATMKRPLVIPMRLVLQPSGVVIELTEPETLVGRHTNTDIRLPLPDVSRKHCRFLFTEGLWQVVNLNSLNGVYVNNLSVDRATLHHQDQIRIGSFTFAVELPEAAQATTIDDGELSASNEVLRSIADAIAQPAPTIQRQAS